MRNPKKRKKKLSMPMIRVLVNLRLGNRAAHHCRTQSDYGGLHGTMMALMRHGLINRKYDLLRSGKDVADRELKKTNGQR
jgi:hypothetical protein